MTIKTITDCLEILAPLAYQESYDNAGLLCGDSTVAITGILCSLDCTENIVDEAIAKNCNLIVAHHPIIFSGLKKITGKNYIERTIIKAIKNDIAIYATHTNLDHVQQGVNAKICELLGLQNCKILAPKRQLLKKLTVFIPTPQATKLLDALAKAGAGQIGNYSHCSFSAVGEGSFKPNEKAKPHIGQAHQIEKVQETRIEVIFPAHAEGAVLAAMHKAHPYEEVAYFVHLLENENQTVGAGMIGELPNTMQPLEFLHHLKDKMQLKVIKHTTFCKTHVKKVAVCGGAGSFLLRNAIAAQADFFVTADYKYHDFFDAENKLVIADIGHYESEQFTKNLLQDYLQAFVNQPNRNPIPVLVALTNTNPVEYFVGLSGQIANV